MHVGWVGPGVGALLVLVLGLGLGVLGWVIRGGMESPLGQLVETPPWCRTPPRW